MGGKLVRKFKNYFFRVNGKILFIKERFEDRKESRERMELLKYIIQNIRVL